MKAALPALLLMLAGCAMNLATRLAADDFAVVRLGRYPGDVHIMNGNPRLERLVAPWRAELESNPDLLHRAAGKYFSMPREPEFHYMSVGEDSTTGRVLLRYFAYAPKPVVYAGWQLQFVFDSRGRLLDVFAAELPLE